MTCKCPSDMHHAINCPEYELPPHLTDRRAARAANPGTARPGEPTIPPHLAHRIEQVKARAVEAGMDPARFDDLLNETAQRTSRAFGNKLHVAPSDLHTPLRAPNPTPDARQVATTLVTVCAVFIVGAYIGRRFSR